MSKVFIMRGSKCLTPYDSGTLAIITPRSSQDLSSGTLRNVCGLQKMIAMD